jgi:hypothetical protein
MGLLDKVKGMLGGHADKVVDGVDKATDMVDDKTGGKFTEHLEKVDDAAADALDEDASTDDAK